MPVRFPLSLFPKTLWMVAGALVPERPSRPLLSDECPELVGGAARRAIAADFFKSDERRCLPETPSRIFQRRRPLERVHPECPENANFEIVSEPQTRSLRSSAKETS